MECWKYSKRCIFFKVGNLRGDDDSKNDIDEIRNKDKMIDKAYMNLDNFLKPKIKSVILSSCVFYDRNGEFLY